jgi:hypothetical protein
MAHRTIVVDSLAYEFVPDDPPPLADRGWSLIQGRAIDEITGKPLAAMRVSVTEPELDVKTGDGGTYTVNGRPWHRFPPLAAPDYSVHLTIEADRYLASTHIVAVPTYQRLLVAPAPAIGSNVITLDSISGLTTGQRLLIGPGGPDQESLTIANIGPSTNQVTLAVPLVHPHGVGAAVVADEFAPVEVADILMHRMPVTVRGRTVRQNKTGVGTMPVANASIVVQGIWRTARDVQQHLPAAAAAAVSLAPGLHAARGVGATVTPQALPPVVGDDKLLVTPASAGDSFANVSNRLNLVVPPAPPPYSVLCIDADDLEAAEYIGLAGADGLGGADEPGRVEFDHALRLAHRRNIRAQRVAPLPPAPPRTLTDAGEPGDSCVFVNNVTGLAAVGTVAVAGGPAPREYQQVRTFEATSNSEGYFGLPPLSRVAQIRINASAPPLAAVTFDYQPDYAQRENWIDVVFP